MINSKDVQVNWSTAMEENNDYFIVERRYEFEHEFTEVARTPGAGTSNDRLDYRAVDYTCNWLSPTVYYRIKQVDYNGEYSYSHTVAVSKTAEVEVLMYPNPAQQETTVAVLGDVKVKQLRIIDMMGKDVSMSTNMQENSQVYSIDLSGLRNGAYIIEVITNEERITERLTIAR